MDAFSQGPSQGMLLLVTLTKYAQQAAEPQNNNKKDAFKIKHTLNCYQNSNSHTQEQEQAINIPIIMSVIPSTAIFKIHAPLG
jgi:hypothetical protein